MDVEIIILGLGELLLTGLLFYLWHELRSVPSNDEVLQELDELSVAIDNSMSEIHQYMADTNDRLEGVLAPILKRNASRDAREARKEAKNSDGVYSINGRNVRAIGGRKDLNID